MHTGACIRTIGVHYYFWPEIMSEWPIKSKISGMPFVVLSEKKGRSIYLGLGIIHRVTLLLYFLIISFLLTISI